MTDHADDEESQGDALLAVRKLASEEFEIEDAVVNGCIAFYSKKIVKRIYTGIFIPEDEAEILLSQLKMEPKALPDHFGFYLESGYIELTLEATFPRPLRVESPMRPPVYQRLISPQIDCPHSSSPFASIPPQRPQYWVSREPDPSVQLWLDGLRNVHVHEESTNTCLEISPSSPCGVLYGVPNGRAQNGFGPTSSLKIQLNPAGGNLVSRAYNLANSFLYELAIRNGVSLQAISRAEFEEEIPRTRRPKENQIRFPRTRIGPEVSELYSFAESARRNLPLAFLSFYQVLEYFFPQAIRRMTIRNVRRELEDPQFGNADADIVRIIGIAETGVRSSEADQIAELLTYAAREDRLLEFFSDPIKQKYFGKHGPIGGVDTINIENKRDRLAAQVANRVYKLRNRIVHAKDDPKYLDSKVLLPRSREAMMLWPDVELVRLLAREVIADSQV